MEQNYHKKGTEPQEFLVSKLSVSPSGPGRIMEVILGVIEKHSRDNAVTGHSQHGFARGKSWLTENQLYGLPGGSPATSPTNKQFFCSLSRVAWALLPHPPPPPLVKRCHLFSTEPPGRGEKRARPPSSRCLPQVARDTHNLAEGGLSHYHPGPYFRPSPAAAPPLT